MASLLDLLTGGSAMRVHARARKHLANGACDEADKVLKKGLERWPGSQPLRELLLTSRRVQARSRIQSLKMRIVHSKDPEAYAALCRIYRDVELMEESRRTAVAFAEQHPTLSDPHALLGEAELEAYTTTLDSREGYSAQRHLSRAHEIDPSALKPLLLLAELYWVVGAPKRLAQVATSLRDFDEAVEGLPEVMETIEDVADASAAASYEGLLERIEVEGHLPRDPAAWPLRTSRNQDAGLEENRAKRAVRKALQDGLAQEILVQRRNGSVIAHGTEDQPEIDDDQEVGLANIARVIARTVVSQVPEFDLGSFRRCSMEGEFGQMVVGRHGSELVVAHHTKPIEPLRLWDRLSGALAEAAEGGAA